MNPDQYECVSQDNSQREMINRFEDQIDNLIDQVDNRIDRVDGRIDQVNMRTNRINDMVTNNLGGNYTYNRQRALNRFGIQDKIRRERQKIVLQTDPDQVDNDDLLVTNNLDASFTNENTVGTLPNNRRENRYFQENYVYQNISSRQRQRFIERPVIAQDRETFPNKELWDEFFDSETGTFGGDLDICCLTFNNLLEFGQEFPYFFQKENQLFLRVPEDPNPNEYTIVLRPPRRHVRAIRLVSVEGPRFLDEVNDQNNLILVDIIDPCTGESFEYEEDLPFECILIPIGSYTITTLMDRIVALLNQVVANKLTALGRDSCQPFSYFYDAGTGQIDILGEYLFHLKFWFSTTNPQFHLWEMLGYEFPYPRDEENQPTYTHNFTNLISCQSPLIAGKTNLKPFRRPNLDIYDYIYLVINGLDVIQDDSISLDDDVFAKVLVRENRFISSTKIFSVPLDRLEKIRVRWLDPFGNLLDMKGQENSFLLEIIEYQDRLKEADFSSQRGLNNFDQEITRVQHKTVVSIS